MSLLTKMAAAAGIVLMISSCGSNAVEETPDPVMRWDHRPEAENWTAATLEAIETHQSILATFIPRDIKDWCPTYVDNSVDERALFWTGLISALAKHESTWNPQAVGGGSQWYGLVQISPATARGYGCNAKSSSALKNGEANLRCAIRIWSKNVPRDGVVAAGGGGVAADWGPFHYSKKREDMKAWTRAQSYCS
ncbi:transglycosylase SLT domain-containing protein [Falsihalocynthiibacter sp. SS001]|uniref:lytic transglycosylase domain-containing protein n=1 Tax=Falsihalocynthiibacter sp. SS001 TaxID=3349698 RepID=UPI0036D291A7